uniref:Uncharacterized protein n=1 Tax=Anguilla anguilla TaxID=7936 RepID=A0A0E9QJH7_ANGAN
MNEVIWKFVWHENSRRNMIVLPFESVRPLEIARA